MTLEDDPICNDHGSGVSFRADDHDNDVLMPGFRFHPTEEELVEFYLRRKVDGKRFNVELITFLDLYRYDPWELPAMAVIGEKEWFFYVPRDRKYRNGDRPNRVTKSGYWKATGADRMIRGENNRSIGLKKTLVFYTGKAPKGVRSGWIMNEYRLPHHDTERNQKAEISLCRVYKRSGVEENHPSLPRSLMTARASSSRSILQIADASSPDHQRKLMMSMSEADMSSSSDVPTTLGLSKHGGSLLLPSAMEEEQVGKVMPGMSSLYSKSASDFFAGTSSSSSNSAAIVDDMHRLIDFQHLQQPQEQSQPYASHPHSHPYPQPPSHLFPFPALLFPHQASATQSPHNQLIRLLSPPPPAPLTAFSDRTWDWSPIPQDADSGEYIPPFK
ncbi:hypothetical protein MLD38_025590 [Melastoma candidum]|uniref:Uncharacterized protein n=1 Tax=Melastoma candidum TaxID=119954 RepID=A0ACB9NVR7_9MYRT|nr:hypothetical protein MLD38_025590 [Melastoma candidum]